MKRRTICTYVGFFSDSAHDELPLFSMIQRIKGQCMGRHHSKQQECCNKWRGTICPKVRKRLMRHVEAACCYRRRCLWTSSLWVKQGFQPPDARWSRPHWVFPTAPAWEPFRRAPPRETFHRPLGWRFPSLPEDLLSRTCYPLLEPGQAYPLLDLDPVARMSSGATGSSFRKFLL